mmetsp:Transcript_78806/g.219070  ORF Transcript_78806/g.219070 Transcript_78806/m.219070 type:complete len:382 (+) Transcript_78806:54-1199(+)
MQRWYIYLPHWYADAHASLEGESVLVAAEDTWLKRTTSFSWLLGTADKRRAVRGTSLRCAAVQPVTDPEEAHRHAHVREHRCLALAECEVSALAEKEAESARRTVPPGLLGDVARRCEILDDGSLEEVWKGADWFEGPRIAQKGEGVAMRRLRVVAEGRRTAEEFWWHAACNGDDVKGVLVAVAGAGAGPGPAGSYGPFCLYSRLAQPLAACGVAVLLPIWTASQWSDLASATKRLQDVVASSLLGDLLGRGSSKAPVVMLGWSMGGAAVIEAAARTLHAGACRNVRGVCTLAAQSCGVHGDSLQRCCAWLAATAKLPLVFIHGTRDDCLPHSCSEALADWAGWRTPWGQRTTLRLLDGDSHGCWDAEEHVLSFVAACLAR